MRKHSTLCTFCRVLFKVLGRVFAVLAALYALLFTIFFFDLDGKLLYYVVEPFLVKHYDRMERRNPMDMPYAMKKEEAPHQSDT